MKKVLFCFLSGLILFISSINICANENVISAKGKVVDKNGMGVPCASIFIFLTNKGVFYTDTEIETNEYGSFEIELENGDYEISARSVLGKIDEKIKFTINNENVTDLILNSTFKMFTVEGTVRDTDGTPIEGARVSDSRASESLGLPNVTVTTNEFGQYSLPQTSPNEPGFFDHFINPMGLNVYKKDYPNLMVDGFQQVVETDLLKGHQTGKDFILEKPTYDFEGHVYSEDGDFISGVIIESDNGHSTFTTSWSGDFYFKNYFFGEHTFKFSKKGYETKSVNFNISNRKFEEDIYLTTKKGSSDEKINFIDNSIPFMKGYEDSTFRPDEYITRAEALTMLYNIIDEPTKNVTDVPRYTFRDVPNDSWCSKPINYLPNLYLNNFSWHGINPVGMYLPNELVTKEEFIGMLNYFLPKYEFDENFSVFLDVHEDVRYREAIYNAYKAGIVHGEYYGDSFLFGTIHKITRVEAAEIFNNFLNRKYLPNMEYPEFTDIDEDYWGYDAIKLATGRKK